MKFKISVLIVGLVICPFIHATAKPTEGANTSNATADSAPLIPGTVSAPSPFRAESRSAAEDEEEDDEFDLSEIMDLFGGPPQEYSHVKRSFNDYYVDMDMAPSSPKEHQYQWKTAQPKSSGPSKKSIGQSTQLKAGNGKVYTLHIVTNGEQLDNGQSRSSSNNNNNQQHHHHYHNGGGAARVRSPRSKIHVIPITMRSNGKSSNGKARIVKRFRGTRPDDHVKYDSHSHSEETQDIILPAESEVVDTKYEDQKYEIHGPRDLQTNDLKLSEGSEHSESQYMDHDPYDSSSMAEKVKVKHHHHHHHHNHVKTLIKKVPQPYPVEKIVHVPVEKVVHVPKPYPVDKFVEKIVHVPVERVIQVPKPVPVDRIVEKVIHVPKPYPVDRIVEKQVPVNRPVRVNVPYPVEKIVHVPRPYPVEKIVEKLVHVPKPYPVIKHVPYPVEKKVPYPVKVEVEKKVPFPVKVYVPKPYPVEKRVPEVESPPKRNSYRTNFEKNRMPGAQSYQNIHQGQHQHQSSASSGREQFHSQGQASSNSQHQYEQSYVPQMTAMDYGFAQQMQQQQSQQQQQQQNYPYQFESQGSEMQYGVNVMAAQPTGQETEQQDYVFNTSEQSQMGPSGAAAGSASDSVDAASSDSVITPFTSDPKQMAFTRPVDQFVVFHTGTGFTVPKRK